MGTVATLAGTEAETNRRDLSRSLGIMVVFSILMEVGVIQEHTFAKT